MSCRTRLRHNGSLACIRNRVQQRPLWPLDILEERRLTANGVTGWLLDERDIRALVTEQPRAERPGQPIREVCNPKVRQCTAFD